MIKVRHKYAVNKVQNTVKVQSNTVKVQYCTETFLAPTGGLLIYSHVIVDPLEARKS